MFKKPTLWVILLVLVSLVTPTIVQAQTPINSPYCPAPTWDCTTWYTYSSWDRFQAVMAMMWAGYNVTVCCLNNGYEDYPLDWW